jgi:hypothetical protein
MYPVEKKGTNNSPYIIIADVKYHELGDFIQSYLNIQGEGAFWDYESMDLWDEYYDAVNYAEDIALENVMLSRAYAEVKNIRVGQIQITVTELNVLK